MPSVRTISGVNAADLNGDGDITAQLAVMMIVAAKNHRCTETVQGMQGSIVFDDADLASALTQAGGRLRGHGSDMRMPQPGDAQAAPSYTVDGSADVIMCDCEHDCDCALPAGSSA
jgi:hypothetical protein